MTRRTARRRYWASRAGAQARASARARGEQAMRAFDQLNEQVPAREESKQ